MADARPRGEVACGTRGLAERRKGGRKVDCGLGELLGAAELRCLVLIQVQALSVDSLFVAAATSLP